MCCTVQILALYCGHLMQKCYSHSQLPSVGPSISRVAFVHCSDVSVRNVDRLRSVIGFGVGAGANILAQFSVSYYYF